MVVLLLHPFRINVNLFCQIHFLFCLTFCRFVATDIPVVEAEVVSETKTEGETAETKTEGKTAEAVSETKYVHKV